MYLYFDKNGVLKEIINDKALRQGDSYNDNIYIHVEGITDPSDYEVWIRFAKSNNVISDEIEIPFPNYVETQIPYDAKRSLRYFQYYKDYYFFKIPTTQDLTLEEEGMDPDAYDYDMLDTEGNVALTVRLVKGDVITTLGLIVFNVEWSAEDLTNTIEVENYLSLAQFNYLIALMSTKVNKAYVDFKIEQGLENCVKFYPYNETATLQTIYDEVGINKLFYAKLDNRWQLLMLQETSGNYSFAFWDELGYGETDTTQNLSETINNLTFHYTGYYFPYVEKNSLGGSLNDEELAILSQPNSVFICLGNILHKVDTTRFEKIIVSSTGTGGTGILTTLLYITINTSAKTFTFNNSYFSSYSTAGISELLAQKEDLANKTTTITSSSTDTQYPSAKAVYDFTYDRDYIDTTFATKAEMTRVYKSAGSASVDTLNDMTKTSQMNGYVYNMLTSGELVNEDNSTISVSVGDNVVFVWQNGNWVWDKMAGMIDLSGYVQKTTTIAGIDLQDNILAQELTDNLVFATNSDIDSLF